MTACIYVGFIIDSYEVLWGKHIVKHLKVHLVELVEAVDFVLRENGEVTVPYVCRGGTVQVPILPSRGNSFLNGL